MKYKYEGYSEYFISFANKFILNVLQVSRFFVSLTIPIVFEFGDLIQGNLNFIICPTDIGMKQNKTHIMVK